MSATETLDIRGLAHGGAGVARRADGMAVFVAGALPGESVVARVTRKHKRHAEAEVIEVLRPSPDRRTPPCPAFGLCGGCTLQHAEPASAFAALVEAARHDIVRALGEDAAAAIQAPVATPAPWRYRNRVRLHLDGDGRPGFLARDGRTHVPVDDCLLAPEGLVATLAGALEDLRRRLIGRGWREVELREDADGRRSLDARRRREAAVRPTTGADRALAQALLDLGAWTTVRVGDITVGDPALHVAAGPLRLTAAPGAFVQANAAGNARLIETVLGAAGDVRGLRALDLYAGIGNLGLPLAAAGATVDLVEANREAAGQASANIKALRLAGKARSRNESTAEALAARAPGSVDLVVLDPPRSGAAEAIDGLRRLDPPRIVYVSCHLHAMLRDLRALGEGWRAVALTPIDMFPQTGHLEWVVALERA